MGQEVHDSLRPKIDPGALLLAVLVITFAPLSEEGDWEFINTVIAIAVMFVLVPFTWTREKMPARYAAPVSVVYGLTMGLASAWPAQAGWGLSEDAADGVALQIGSMFAVAFFIWFVRAWRGARERLNRLRIRS